MGRLKDLVLVTCLMVTAFLSTADVQSWWFTQGYKSNFRLPVGVYTDSLSAPGLQRGDAWPVSDALDRAQGERYAGVEPSYTVLDLPNKILNQILEFISKLTIYEYIVLEIVFCVVDFGTLALVIVLGRHIERRRRFKYLDRFLTEERDVITSILLSLRLLLGLRRRMAGRVFLFAQWVVIGLLLIAVFNLFQTAPSWAP
jgi:hypothetical protein